MSELRFTDRNVESGSVTTLNLFLNVQKMGDYSLRRYHLAFPSDGDEGTTVGGGGGSYDEEDEEDSDHDDDESHEDFGDDENVNVGNGSISTKSLNTASDGNSGSGDSGMKMTAVRANYERVRLLNNVTSALCCFPNLKQLNVYNSLLARSDVERCLNHVRQKIQQKNEIMALVDSDRLDEARTRLNTDLNQLKQLCSYVSNELDESFRVTVHPGICSLDKTLVLDDLISCGLSPRVRVQEDTGRRFLDFVLHFGFWKCRKVYLEKLYHKYDSLLFSWFTNDDWCSLLSGGVCPIDELTSFFLPKFTQTEFLRILSPSVLANAPYPSLGVRTIIQFGFDVRRIPNLLKSVETLPVLYQLLCDAGCTYDVPTTELRHFVEERLISRKFPCVINKVMDYCANCGMDFKNETWLRNHVFRLIAIRETDCAMILLGRIGAENVRLNRNELNNNTYLHVALRTENSILARHIVQRYGIENIRSTNNDNQTVLHLACMSKECIIGFLDQLVDHPDLRSIVNIKDHCNRYAYDLMLSTLAMSHYSPLMFDSVLQKLKPSTEALNADALIQKYQAKQLKDGKDEKDPNFSRGRKRKHDLTTQYSRQAKIAKEAPTEETSAKPTPRMQLRSRVRKHSNYHQKTEEQERKE